MNEERINGKKKRKGMGKTWRRIIISVVALFVLLQISVIVPMVIQSIVYGARYEDNGFIYSRVDDDRDDINLLDDPLGFMGFSRPYEVVGYEGESANVEIPKTFNGKPVTSIGYAAFRDCTSLKSIAIPDSVTSISWGAFRDCTGLTSITIPGSVTSIGNGAFSGTAYYENDANWENGVLYIGNHLIEAKRDISEAYSVKAGTKCIAVFAFKGCKNLTSVTIPDSVTSIGYEAFGGCKSLTSITFEGTTEQWYAISKGRYWNDYTGRHTIRCKDGKISK